MRRQSRSMHYLVRELRDGTVIGAFPIRKPSPAELRKVGRPIDADGVAEAHFGSVREMVEVSDETRTRQQDLIAANLNTRRAIRSLVLPELVALHEEVADLRAEIAKMSKAVAAATRGRVARA